MLRQVAPVGGMATSSKNRLSALSPTQEVIEQIPPHLWGVSVRPTHFLLCLVLSGCWGIKPRSLGLVASAYTTSISSSDFDKNISRQLSRKSLLIRDHLLLLSSKSIMDKEVTRKLHEERSYSLLTKDFPFVSTSTPMSQETEMVVYPRKHSAQCAMGQNVPWKLTKRR